MRNRILWCLFVGYWGMASGLVYSAETSGEYTIRQGDTLSSIAREQLNNPRAWVVLQKVNKIDNPNRLTPGARLILPTNLAKQPPITAEALRVSGDVKVKRAKTGGFVPLAVGVRLAAGDVLETGAGSSLTVRFLDQSRMLLAPNSRLVLSQLQFTPQNGSSRTVAQLDSGGVESTVQPLVGAQARHEVRTPALSLAAQGATFRVMLDGRTGITRSVVDEGVLQASNARGTTSIPEGYGSRVEPGKAPGKPSALLKAPSIAPVDPPEMAYLPIHFDWQPLEEAMQYRVELLEGDNLDRLVDVRDTIAPRFDWRHLQNGKYQLRIRGLDHQGLEGQAGRLDFSVQAWPAAPLVNVPLDQTVVGEGKVRFRWARHPGAEYYRFQVAETPDFANPVMQVRQLTARSSGMTVKLLPGKYFWRVAAGSKRDGLGPFGKVQTFEVRPMPADRDWAAEGSTVLRWHAGQSGERYQIQVARDASFVAPIISREQTDAQLTLPDNEALYVRIRRISPSGLLGEFDAPQLFDPALN